MARKQGKATKATELVRESRKKAAIEAFIKTGTVTGACRTCKLGVGQYYRWIDNDPEFAEAHEAAKMSVADNLEEEALRRAYDGDHTLIIFLLKGLLPHKYGDRPAVETRITTPIMIKVPEGGTVENS